jgi:hypothetical protein
MVKLARRISGWPEEEQRFQPTLEQPLIYRAL